MIRFLGPRISIAVLRIAVLPFGDAYPEARPA